MKVLFKPLIVVALPVGLQMCWRREGERGETELELSERRLGLRLQ